MFLVLVVHANYWFLGRPDLVQGLTGSTLSRVSIEALAVVCVNCFILISGYFGIRPKLRSLLHLFTQILFIYIISYLAACLLGVVSFSLSAFIDNCLAFSKANWFVQAYLMLMLFAPVLNAFIDHCSRRSFTLYVLLFLIIEVWFGEVRKCDFCGFNGGYSVVHFMMLYCLARLLYLYRDDLREVKSYMWLFSYLLCSIVVALMLLLGITIDYSNPFVIFSSVCLFLFFASFDFKSRIINWLAGGSFAVYLLHTREPILSWFRHFDIEAYTTYSTWAYIISILGVMLLIFFGSILFDKVRKYLFTPLIDKACQVNWKRYLTKII